MARRPSSAPSCRVWSTSRVSASATCPANVPSCTTRTCLPRSCSARSPSCATVPAASTMPWPAPDSQSPGNLADGSWPYSEESFGRWVDGFHTGFVLEGLSRVVAATGDAKLRSALERGVRFYVAQLFGPRGEPKSSPQRAYPLDALSAAQGVETLWLAVGGAARQAVPGQLDWVRRRLVRPDGTVAYQVHRAWTDWRQFPRWASAPLMAALAGVAAQTGPCPTKAEAGRRDERTRRGLDRPGELAARALLRARDRRTATSRGRCPSDGARLRPDRGP